MGLVELPETELRLYMAYTEYVISDFGRRESRVLREALTAANDLNPNTVTMDEATMWYQLSRGNIKRRNYHLAVQSAGKVEAIISKLDPDNVDFMTHILLIRGVTKLMPTPLSNSDIIDSHFDLDRAYHGHENTDFCVCGSGG